MFIQIVFISKYLVKLDTGQSHHSFKPKSPKIRGTRNVSAKKISPKKLIGKVLDTKN